MRNGATYLSAKRRRHIERLAKQRRILTDEQAQRAHHMRARGLGWPSIAAWFTRNGTPIEWKAVKRACERVSMRSEAA